MSLLEQSPSHKPNALATLRNRNYFLYWFGLLVNITGVAIQTVALGWVVLDMTNSPFYLGLVGLFQSLPTIVLTPVGGVAADRLDRRRLLMADQLIWGLSVLALAILASLGLLQVWQILIVAVISGVVLAFDGPTRHAMFPQLLGKEHLPNAVALNSSVFQIARIVGPSIAGTLLSVSGAGAALCFYFMAGSCFVMCAAMAMVRTRPIQRTPSHGSAWQNLMGGLLHVYRDPILRVLMGTFFFNSLFGMSYVTLMPVFARDILHAGPSGLGLLMFSSGVGAVCGTLALLALGRSRRRGAFMLITSSIYGLVLLVFAWSTWFPLSFVLVGLAGGIAGVYMTTCNTLLQTKVPDHLRGRVMALYTMSFALVPLGGMQAGTVAELVSAPVAVTVGGVAVICFALFTAIRVPAFRALQ